jgi:hypothetical protein
MNPPATGVIPEGGTKGLLKWIQQAMPAFYAEMSPRLIALARGPGGNASTLGAINAGRRARLSAGQRARLKSVYGGKFANRTGLDGLGDYSSYVTGSISYTDPTSGLSTSAYTSTSEINPGYESLTVGPASTTSSVVNVANTAPASPSIANAIASIANGVAAGTVAAAQLKNNNTLLATNLQRAQQGLPPLTASIASSGLASLSSPLTLILFAAVAFLFIGKEKSV